MEFLTYLPRIFVKWDFIFAENFYKHTLFLYFQSPAHSYSSYDSGKNESVGRGAEDLSLNRGDEDEDDHDEQEDPEKVNESDGVEAERLKAFNVSPLALTLFTSILFALLFLGEFDNIKGTLICGTYFNHYFNAH